MGYRIPKITEFKDRFEFEVYSEGYFDGSLEDLCGWYKYTYGINNWRDDEELLNELSAGNIRVKI